MAAKSSVARLDHVAKKRSSTETATPTTIPGKTALHTAVSHGSGAKDFFVRRQGVVFAGTHLLVELWQGQNLNDATLIDTALRTCVEVCGATLLHIHLHEFSENGGISGVAVLAESHISIHTWPEIGYAAIDIFMCGTCDPYKAVPILRQYFLPEAVQLSEHKRGIMP